MPHTGPLLAHNESLTHAVRAWMASDRTGDVNTFLMTFEPQWHRMAVQLSTRFATDSDFFEQILQSVREEAWTLLVSPPDDLDPGRYGGLVVFRTQRRIYKMVREHSSPLSGTSKIAERRSAVERTRTALLAELGYEPSDEDLLARHNAAVLERNPRASAQGGIARLSDIGPGALPSMQSLSAADFGDDTEHERSISNEERVGGDYDEQGLIDIIDVLTRAVASLESDVAMVVRYHLAVLLENGVAASATVVGNATGVSANEARRYVALFREALIAQLDYAANA